MNNDTRLSSVTVRVPATTANLGPGFDALGLALSLHNYVTLSWREEPDIEVSVAGEGEVSLPRDASNIAVQAVERGLDALGERPSGYRLHLHNAIPLSRGLGSSAAARVGALFAVNELTGRQLADDDMLALAVELEGHPDNVSATLLGGLVASTVDDRTGRALALRVTAPNLPAAVVLIPATEIATEDARRVVPDTLSKADTAFNLGHACLTLAALIEGDDHLLAAAMRDKVHQPYREQLMPWLSTVIEAALEAGAVGAALSGAGSTMLAFARGDCAAIEAAMLTALQSYAVAAHTLVLQPDFVGAATAEAP